MKLVVKKIYCPTCQKLVMPLEETTSPTVARIVCQKCKNVIWTKDNFAWRHFKGEN